MGGGGGGGGGGMLLPKSPPLIPESSECFNPVCFSFLADYGNGIAWFPCCIKRVDCLARSTDLA